MSTEKTHYRKAFKSPYLSSADITSDTVLTISHVILEPDKSKKTKDSFNTAYFVEKEIRPGDPLKPMILNVGNSEFMKKVTGSHWIDDWKNVRVCVYVQSGVKFGKEFVEGLRLKEVPKRPEVLPSTPMWDRAKKSFTETGSFETVLKHADISEENRQKMIEEIGFEQSEKAGAA